MNAQTIQQTLLPYLAQVVGTPVEPATPLFDEGLLDSMRAAELVAFLERSFSIHLEMEDLTTENFATACAMVGLVLSKLGQAAA